MAAACLFSKHSTSGSCELETSRYGPGCFTLCAVELPQRETMNVSHNRQMSETKAFNTLKDCRHGKFLFNRNDAYIGRSLELYGEYSEGEVSLFRQVLKPGFTVLDLGANIGVHTVFLARTVGERGRVYAFEPQRLLFQTLCANVALNCLTNVMCEHAAVSDRAGRMRIGDLNPWTQQNFGGYEMTEFNGGDPVPLVTVDSFERKRCEFMKIDVEGMELEAIRGASDTISRTQPIIYIENRQQDKSDALIQLISSYGYDLYWHLPCLFNPSNYAGNADNVFGKVISRNMLCMPKGSSVDIRNMQPVEIKVRGQGAPGDFI